MSCAQVGHSFRGFRAPVHRIEEMRFGHCYRNTLTRNNGVTVRRSPKLPAVSDGRDWSRWGNGRPFLACGFSGPFGPVGTVRQAVEDGVGHCGIADGIMSQYRSSSFVLAVRAWSTACLIQSRIPASLARISVGEINRLTGGEGPFDDPGILDACDDHMPTVDTTPVRYL